MFNRCDGSTDLVHPSHSDFGLISSSALANRSSARMGDSLGGAFYVTCVENLPSIVRCGLVPSGIDGGNRLALHFGAFAPTLAQYGAGVANGTFMVFDVIPFYEVKSIWMASPGFVNSFKSRCDVPPERHKDQQEDARD